MKGRHILLLSYYWPPAGGIAVQRWLQMSHHLAEMGWQITVVTSANPDYPQLDPNLINRIHPSIKSVKIKGFEPRNFLAKLSTIFQKNKQVNLDNALNQNSKKQGLIQKFILWIRSNFFIPDARIGWSKRVSKEIPKLQIKPPDLIISTGPPHSTHIAAKSLATFFSIPWVADFRDPWMEIEYFGHLNLTRRSLKRHRSLEFDTLSSADLVTTVSPSWATLFQSKGARRTEVILNGYDSEDFQRRGKHPDPGNDHFTISHLGTLGEDRLVPAFFKACQTILLDKKLSDLRLVFAGNTTEKIRDLALDHNLSNEFNDVGFLTHAKAVDLMFESSMLLLIQNQVEKNIKGRIPAKVFEYMATRNPILMIGDIQSDLAKILLEYPNAFIADFEDQDQIYHAIVQSYQQRTPAHEFKIPAKFTRKHCAEQVNNLLKELITEESDVNIP